MPGASSRTSSRAVDRLIDAYGGLGAIPRALQMSHWYLDNELQQLQSVGLILPVVFLLVAAFLLNVVLTRIVSVQREQIAALKALGYTNRELALALHQAEPAHRRRRCGVRRGGRRLARLRHDVDLQRLLPVSDAARTGCRQPLSSAASRSASSPPSSARSTRSAASRRLPPAEAMRPEAAGALPAELARARGPRALAVAARPHDPAQPRPSSGARRDVRPRHRRRRGDAGPRARSSSTPSTC